MAPSNSVPRPVLIVAGLNDFQTIVSQMFVAMNSEILCRYKTLQMFVAMNSEILCRYETLQKDH